MSTDSVDPPTRVAIIGAGPAGFFAADALLRQDAVPIEVDLFERLPVPFGLVRSGVAPDHQKIKNVTKTFERTAQSGQFRFLGNVHVGTDVSIAELSECYDLLVVSTGSATDRHMNIPGEGWKGSHPATAFVGWYNAHPDFRDAQFNFESERAVVVGVGNVALDVARVLLKDPTELSATDIASYAVDALRSSHVREVVLLGRRGPAQAAFGYKELTEVLELPDVRVVLDANQVRQAANQLDTLDSGSKKNVELMLQALDADKPDAPKTLRIEFFASPLELHAEEARVCAVEVERTQLVADGAGELRSRGTGEHFRIETGLVFRSIGYAGVPLEGVPFDDRRKLIPNVDGRVTDGAGGAVLPGLYVTGWIRRGPTGIIGTNKADAKSVSALLLEDAKQGVRLTAAPKGRECVDALLAERRVSVITFDDWTMLDQLEVAEGARLGKVREKFASVREMLLAVRNTEAERATD